MTTSSASDLLGLRADLATRAAYTSDASIYRRMPAGVLEPTSEGHLAQGLAWARARGLGVISRGGGTSVAGNAIGEGLVLDTSRYLNDCQIDPEQSCATVQPGLVCDDLRTAAAVHGLTYGPDPSTHSRCTIGGMVANNACGSHSVAWGTSAENLRAVRMLLADGRVFEAWKGGCDDPRIEAELRSLVQQNAELIRAELGRFPRQVSGYGLHYLLPEKGFDVAKALAGSEGTCGVFTQLTVDLVRPPAATALAVLGYPDAFAAARAAATLRRPGVLTIEGMGSDLLAALRSRPGRGQDGQALPAGGAWLYCEVAGADPAGAQAAAEELLEFAGAQAQPDPDRAGSTGEVVTGVVVTDRAQSRLLWGIREAAAGIATRRADGGEAWPGWEDSAVPVEHLADYLRDLYALMAERGLRGIPFGHFGEGCIHVRIDFDLGSEQGIAAYREFIVDAAKLVHRYGGSVSGEHGDGRARSEMLAQMYSPQMLALFARFKAIFDPDGALNPGVLVNPEPVDDRLRPGPGLRTHVVIPVHALSRDGGDFASAINRCVGVGVCRSDTGAMCPSYQATRDEVHTTRGRARVLAEMLRGENLTGGWDNPQTLEALDLCLSCKACSTECPVNVDMATYKAEFLHHHYAHRRRPMAHYAMGWLPVSAALVSALPGLGKAVNQAMRVRPLEKAVLRAAGLETRRSMVSFAEHLSLAQWFAQRARRGQAPMPAPQAPVIVLWPDTFTNHLSPHVGIAGVEVLEALGFHVVLPRGPVCCGLTWHSTGQLDVTKAALRRSLTALAPHIAAGHRVVGLEPSCLVMLSEAHELLPEDERARALKPLLATFAEIVDERAEAGNWPFARIEAKAVTQVHCHQKATRGSAPDERVLARLGVDLDLVGGGCCGLAGNFGFEQGHYEVSQACAERELFPKVNAGDGLVIADGFSCRTQVGQGTEATGRHLAEVLRSALVR
ncbi:FAD-binding and (Fe-S)-binding domain-containing protein [Gephyromycinifex aptenodytis]|uniref:FAD-binding and (Fe-S)-binding domain-containing protein n=1 Tax=Gephyromycinifex aptenodytis TaxID=2716227 RepID=UPI001D02B2E3|nr:FAD-binding and (Fe-S)-binding domain-containing protein [Gephyromycinifex aptenodytis]